MITRRMLTGTLAVLAFAGCVGEAEPAVVARGVYAIDGTWDVGAPIGGERTLGVVAAELLVDEAVQAAGVPSALEDGAREALFAAVGDRIREQVDASAPPELAPGSPLLETLGAIAANVHYASELDVDTHGRDVAGVERIERVWVEHEGREWEAPLDLDVPEAPSLEASWEGRAGESEIEVDPHAVELRFGAFVAWLAGEVLGADTEALQAQATSAIACDAIVERITGGAPHVEIEVGLETIRIEAGDLSAACGAMLRQVEQRALGMFAYDTPLEIGGSVALIDADGDGVAEALQSGDDHGGVVVITARALSPRVRSGFTGAIEAE